MTEAMASVRYGDPYRSASPAKAHGGFHSLKEQEERYEETTAQHFDLSGLMPDAAACDGPGGVLGAFGRQRRPA